MTTDNCKRTWFPSDESGECPRNGLGGGVNLRYYVNSMWSKRIVVTLIFQIEAACWVLKIFFPIMAVTAGFIMLTYYSVTFLMKIFPYLLSDDIELILSCPSLRSVLSLLNLDEGL